MSASTFLSKAGQRGLASPFCKSFLVILLPIHREVAHNLWSAGSTMLKFIVAEPRLDFDVADSPKRGKRLYWTAGYARNLVDYDKINRPDQG